MGAESICKSSGGGWEHFCVLEARLVPRADERYPLLEKLETEHLAQIGGLRFGHAAGAVSVACFSEICIERSPYPREVGQKVDQNDDGGPQQNIMLWRETVYDAEL